MLKSAIETLDPTNPDHWTSDKQPRVEVVSKLVGREVTRKEITEALLEPVAAPEAPVPKTGAELYEETHALLEAKLEIKRAVGQEVEALERRLKQLRRYQPQSGQTKEQKAQGIRDYIKTQHEVRMAKAMANKAREAAYPSPVDTRSALDKALQDKSNRNRPRQ